MTHPLAVAARLLSGHLDKIAHSTRMANRYVGRAADWHTLPTAAEDPEGGGELTPADLTDLADLVSSVAQLRRELGDLEGYLEMRMGRAVRETGAETQGYVPDGRMWTLHRTADRKAWDHDLWQSDARAAVIEANEWPAQVIDPDSGEEIPTHTIMAAIEKVHGAGAPRTGVLKAMGLDPADYCEQVPGRWKLDVVAPSPNADTKAS